MVCKIWCVICRLLILLIYTKLLSKMKNAERDINQLPEQILLKIFQHFTKQQLGRVEQVSRRFQKIANDRWKLLYQEVFEYDQPLFKLEPCKFKFISPDKSAYKNPWKESFKQLYRGVHVRSDSQNLMFESQNLQHFDNIYDALEYVRRQSRRDSSFQSLVFLHAGTYNLDQRGAIYIENDLMLIGAAPGKNVAKSVIINGNKDIIIANEKHAYIGYLTLELISEASSEQDQYCCLKIQGSPIVEHCIIKNSISKCAAVYVAGDEANPLIKNCDISYCGYTGLHVEDNAKGTYEDNTISCNGYVGIWTTKSANPTVRRNNIHFNKGPGIYISYDGSGHFEDNSVYDNLTGFEISYTYSNITIKNNNILNKGYGQYTQKVGVIFFGSSATLEGNNIFNHSSNGVEINDASKPVIRNNTIKDNGIGIYVSENGFGLLKQNYISKSITENVFITKGKAILKRNHIFDSQGCGISIHDESTANLEANVIYENAEMGVRIAKSQTVLQKNKVLNNGTYGVAIFDNIAPTLKFNIIQFNGSNGLSLPAGMQQRLIRKGHGNKIRDNSRS